MDRGVHEVHAPDGRTWWVKRGWVPRYRNLRDYTRTQLEGREDRWYLAPLRWYAGRGSNLSLDPPTGGYADVPLPYLNGGSGADVASSGGAGTPAPSGGAGDPGGALGLPGGGGGGADPGLVAPAFAGIGGSPDPTSAMPGSDFASGVFGGGGSIPGAGAVSATGGASGSGGGVGGGDPGDAFLAILVVAGVVLAAIAVALLLWIVVLPAVLAVVDGAVLVLAALLAGAVRVLFRRPWDVVATYEGPDGDETWRWEIRGFHRAGRVRDDVARAFGTSTDPDLAVARVLVDTPWDGDPPGAARSVRELRVH